MEKVQESVAPSLSVHIQFTVVGPNLRKMPDGGVQDTAGVAPSESEHEGLSYVTRTPDAPVSALILRSAGHVIIGELFGAAGE